MEIPVELKKKYLERRIQEIDHLLSALEHNDFTPALSLGHQVKGSAATFDFPEIAPLGLEIETAARNHDAAKIKNLVEMMATEIQHARLNFQ